MRKSLQYKGFRNFTRGWEEIGFKSRHRHQKDGLNKGFPKSRVSKVSHLDGNEEK